jgi:hypothetical protein
MKTHENAELFAPPYLSCSTLFLSNDKTFVHPRDGFRLLRRIRQSTVWSFYALVFTPFLDQDLRFECAVEHLSIQDL